MFTFQLYHVRNIRVCISVCTCETKRVRGSITSRKCRKRPEQVSWRRRDGVRVEEGPVYLNMKKFFLLDWRKFQRPFSSCICSWWMNNKPVILLLQRNRCLDAAAALSSLMIICSQYLEFNNHRFNTEQKEEFKNSAVFLLNEELNVNPSEGGTSDGFTFNSSFKGWSALWLAASSVISPTDEDSIKMYTFI